MQLRALLSRWPRLLCAVLGAFSGVTLCWIVWGLFFTPGDYFANGSSLVNVTLPIALLIGGWLAYLAGPFARSFVVLISLLCAAFWILLPDGWWVTPPPLWS